MVEPAASSYLEDNISNPFAPWIYGVSTAGRASARRGARSVRSRCSPAPGFADVTSHETPGDPLDTMFVTTRPVA